MTYPQIEHHGAITGVTGSCHQLHAAEEHSLLVDCGLFQGAETSAEGKADANQSAIDFDISTVKALLLSHVHTDHVGRLPNLLAAGYDGPIICSQPSARLLPLVLEDAFQHSFGRDAKRLESYQRLVGQRLLALPYNSWYRLIDEPRVQVDIRLQRAGHILGSAYIECDWRQAGERRRIVFSGDLGSIYTPLLPAPRSPWKADILVLESTYGDRLHEDRRTRQQRLKSVIERALADGGSVLIPAFSLGRTQELLYELEDIIHRQLRQPRTPGNQADGNPEHWTGLPIILDSPLASRFTRAYRDLQPFWDAEAHKRLRAGRDPLAFEQLLTVDEHDAHLRIVRHLAQTARPAVVIAGGGMCSGGRIVNYLKAMLGDPRHNVLFVGYQAEGTAGRAIQKYGPRGGYVELDGERFQIRAGIDSVNGYSAHADQKGLLNFVTCMRHWPSEIRLVHGEEGPKRELARVLRESYAAKGLGVVIGNVDGA